MNVSYAWTMTAEKRVEFEIVETTDIFDPGNPALAAVPGGGTCAGTRLVILDEVVETIFGERVRSYFEQRGVDVAYMLVKAGDDHKTIDQVLQVASRLNEIGTSRVSTPPIAIGGGALQDVVGMAAALYRRGIPYVRVPTTLLSQIDGSTSAKNGVNYESFRNRLGTFAPPPRTVIDRSLIATLPERQVRSGLGEAVKMALVKDARLFEILEVKGADLVADRLQDSAPDDRILQPGREVMRRSIAGMAEELQKDLWETDLARILDYGHTFSPCVEMTARPLLLHGEAVAMGSVFCAVLSTGRGLLPADDLVRIVDTVRGIGLAPSHPIFCDAEFLKAGFADTVRHRDGRQHLALLTGIGTTTFVNDLTDEEIEQAAGVMKDLLDDRDWPKQGRPTRAPNSSPPEGPEMTANTPTVPLADGVEMPRIGLGTWPLSDREACETVATAARLGYRLVDTAARYGNERGVGEGLRRSGIAREEFFVTSKLAGRDHGYDRTMRAFDASLDRLGLDHLDLYLIHWPLPMRGKYTESWRACTELLAQGRVRAIGVSNFTPAHIEAVVRETGVKPSVNQIQLNPRMSRPSWRSFAARQGITVQSWGPLGQDGSLLREPVVTETARRHRTSAAQVILRWHLDLGVVPVPKSADPGRLAANIDVFGLELTEAERDAITDALDGTGRPMDPDTFEED
ncbi:aldo/keto reductase [Kitasatospora sp. NPDC101176]|uniref:aldo/keto reductase n=1 Tax=Kitasatospora sp. NPDC101176 TaxID=3364099 RepID=UPI003820F81E